MTGMKSCIFFLETALGEDSKLRISLTVAYVKL